MSKIHVITKEELNAAMDKDIIIAAATGRHTSTGHPKKLVYGVRSGLYKLMVTDQTGDWQPVIMTTNPDTILTEYNRT